MNNTPKIIHQIWLQGEDNISEEDKKKIINTKKLHQNWKYILWDEPMIINLVKKNKEYLNKYYKFIYLHQKVDFAKFVIIEEYGGIYIDIDCDVIKNLDNIYDLINKNDLVISKLPALDPVKNLIGCNKTSACYNNGIIVGKPNSKVIKFLINGFETECSYFSNKMLCIENTTGPLIFNNLVDYYIKNISDKDILILPNYYFEPCFNGECNIVDNTYIIHNHELTWLGPHFKPIFKTIGSINFTYLSLVILFFIILLFFIKKKSN